LYSGAKYLISFSVAYPPSPPTSVASFIRPFSKLYHYTSIKVMTAAFRILYSLSLYHATYVFQHHRGFHQSLQETARIVPYLIVRNDHPHALSNSSSSDHRTFGIFLNGTSRCEADTQAYEKLLSIAALFVYWSYCDVVCTFLRMCRAIVRKKSSVATF
jgi:hypothetical protein